MQHKIKIALVCTEKLPVPPIAGGAVQLYIEGIVPYLIKQYEITVFSIQYPGLPDEEINNNVKYIRVPGKTDTSYINNLKSRLDKTYDLIHVFNRPRTVLALVNDLPNSRFSLSLHNEMFQPEKISDADGAKCIERVEFINTVSEFIAEGVKKRFPFAENKLHVVYSGADLHEYKPNWSAEGINNKMRLKKEYGLQDYKVVLFVGRLSVKKGVHILLNAMKKVMESNKNVALVIIGSKWYGKNESDEYVRSLQTRSLSLPYPIVFTGFIPPSEIPAYFNLGDVFVCTSQWNEPLARVHYEAMAAGLPIITTNRGGNAEVIEGYGNGIIVNEYDDFNAFAGHIDYLLNNPAKMLAMGKTGRTLAEEKFNWERVAKEAFEPLILGD
jgi:spore coat protein SA